MTGVLNSVISVQRFTQDIITNFKLPGDDVFPTNHRPDAMNNPINVTYVYFK